MCLWIVQDIGEAAVAIREVWQLERGMAFGGGRSFSGSSGLPRWELVVKNLPANP